MKARTIWISDTHLGTALCQYEKLLAFLKSFESDDKSKYNLGTLYLNGDIIDIAQMNTRLFWTKHRIILKKLLRMADKGVVIIYCLGNHEEPYRSEFLKQTMYDINLNGITLHQQAIHTGVDGKKYLITHGDEMDGVISMNPWLYKIGDIGYSALIKINKLQNFCRKLIGLKEWSFSLWAKTKVKDAVKFIANFEQLVTEEARKYGVSGVISGHVHSLDDKMIDEIRYLNSGCWTEFTSYIIEHADGTIEAKMYE